MQSGRSATEDQVEVRGVVAWAGGRRKVRPGLPQRDGADLPAAEDCIFKVVHVTQVLAIAADWKLIDRRDQEALAPRAHHVAAIGAEIESISHRRSVVDLGRED